MTRLAQLALLALLAISGSVLACGGDDGKAPEAHLDAPPFVSLGQRARLSAARSTDADGDIAGYRFIVADGTTALETPEPTVDHLFKLAGWIEVQLEVVDTAGRVGRASALVSVRRP